MSRGKSSLSDRFRPRVSGLHGVHAAAGRRSYRRTRIAAGAGLGLIGIDGAMLTATVLIAPPFVWPLALAVPASLTRIALTVRAMPAMLAR